MPRKLKDNAPRKVSPAEALEIIEAAQDRARKVWDLDHLLGGAVQHAQRIIDRNHSGAVEAEAKRRLERLSPQAEIPPNASFVNEANHDAAHIRKLAANILEWHTELLGAIEATDAKRVAVLALKLGASARELELWERLFENWPTPKEAAKVLATLLHSEIRSSEVWKLVRAGKLKCNGAKGSRRRINPMSILNRLQEVGVPDCPSSSEIESESAEIREGWSDDQRGKRRTDYTQSDLSNRLPDDVSP